jgi:hypothetical protein
MDAGERCWCNHQARHHRPSRTGRSRGGTLMQVCEWCIKLKLRGRTLRGKTYKYGQYPLLFSDEEHELAAEVPEWMLRAAMDRLEEAIRHAD